MKLRQIEIDLPASHVYDQIRKQYFGLPYGSVLASFDPQTLLVDALPPRAPHRPDGLIPLDDYMQSLRAGLAARPTPEHQLDFLMAETSFAHEICHFHDCVCSSGGFLAFARDWSLAFSIYVHAKELRKAGWIAADSLLALYQSQDAPPQVAEIFNLYCSLMLYRIIGNGDLEWIEVEPETGELDVVWGRFPLGDRVARLPFFPANMGIEGTRRCFLIPIGFRAITEGRAVLHQLFAIRSFGQHYVDLYLQNLGLAFEYRVVNMLFTRVVKNNGLDPHEGRWASDELFRVLAATLARDSGELDRPIGAVLIEEMMRVDPRTGIYAGSHVENVTHMKAALDMAAPNLFTEYRTVWHGYQMRDLALDSFRRAIEVYAAAGEAVETAEEASGDTAGPAPDTLDWYGLLSAQLLPQPPISTRGRQLGYLATLTEEDVALRAAAAAATILFRRLLEQAMWQKDLVCPVLDGPYSEFLLEAHIHEHCEHGIVACDCGRFAIGDDLGHHCNCAWKAMAQDVGLARPDRPARRGQRARSR
jgi:hypothetical protein